MSLDLVKNALYQAFKAAMPELKLYPVHIKNQTETFPNLSFVDLSTEHQDARVGLESLQVPNPDTTAGAAPYIVTPVIARKVSHLRLQLRDSLGKGPEDAAAHQKIRDQHNAIDRFLTKTRKINIGPAGAQTLAEIWYEDDREGYDMASGVFLHEYEVRIDPWRLLDAVGVPSYRADSIQLDIERHADNAILITRLYPLA